MSRLVAIGLGSNLGESLTILRGACRAMNDLPQTRVRAVSRVRLTRPILSPWRKIENRPENDNAFLNAVALLETSLSPVQLLENLMAIEQRFGRERTHRWDPRTLDLDILLDEAGSYCDEHLLIPHPRLASRLFFLMCLEELLPEWRHPWCDLTVREMIQVLSSRPSYLIAEIHTLDERAAPNGNADSLPNPYLDITTLYGLLLRTLNAEFENSRKSKKLSWQINDLPYFGWNDTRSCLRAGCPVVQICSINWMSKSEQQTEEEDWPRPRLILLGPGAKGILWGPESKQALQERDHSSAGLPDLSLLRACATPVGFVEHSDTITWFEHIMAALKASEESGRPLGELT